MRPLTEQSDALRDELLALLGRTATREQLDEAVRLLRDYGKARYNEGQADLYRNLG